MDTISSRLNKLVNNEKSGSSLFTGYNPDAIRRLLKHYGDPHRKLKTVHIAGTNGKGSVAHMLQGIMMAAGYSAGLYTSPHLLRLNERIRINRREITNSDLLKYIDDLLEVAALKKVFPTWFDALTIAAIRYFYDQHVNIAIIETGLGGRLDSTNVVSPLASIITNVSRDHIPILGTSIKEIAAEKAGIIKPTIPVISAVMNGSARDVITSRALECSSHAYLVGRDIRIRNIRVFSDSLIFDFAFLDKRLKAIKLNTTCRFQAVNASCAASCSVILNKEGFDLSENHIRRGLYSSLIPGRFLMISNKPPVLFDPAHNPAAIRTLINSIKERFPGKKFIAVVSFMKDKDYPSMLRLISRRLTSRVFYYELPDERCAKPPVKRPLSKTNVFFKIKSFGDTQSLADALRGELSDSTVIIVTGSFRLFATAKETTLLIK